MAQSGLHKVILVVLLEGQEYRLESEVLTGVDAENPRLRWLLNLDDVPLFPDVALRREVLGQAQELRVKRVTSDATTGAVPVADRTSSAGTGLFLLANVT